MALGLTIKGFEVHARIIKQQLVFRIWDDKENRYVTEEMIDRQQVADKLVDLEVARFRQKVISEADMRIRYASHDGFESHQMTIGTELHRPWHEEGKPIAREN